EGKAVPAAGPDTLAIPSCGRPLPGHEIRIVDATGYELPERQVGRLEFRGPSATGGYFRNPAASAQLLRGGWLDSGDYAYLADGEVYIAGRVKDLIKRGGRSLYPYELEQAVGNLPGVRKGCVAVFASRDPAAGTERLVVMAETRARTAAERAELQRRINQAALDATGAPADDIALVPPHTVLKTSSGKIRRLASKEAYERGIPAQAASAPRLQTVRFLASMQAARAKVGLRRAAALLFGCRAWLMLILLVLFCALPIALLRRPAAGRRIARAGARALFSLCGVRIEAHGLERLPRGAHVLLANHASYLDAIALTALLPPHYAYAAKQEFARQPLMRAFLGGLGAVFIERFDIRRSEEEVARMTDALKHGERLVVFPEGGFSRAAGLQPFHAGAFLAAARAGVPLVAAGLRGTRAALRGGTWLPRKVPLALEIGESLAAHGKDWAGAAATSAAARAAIARLSGEFAWLD
ncbi:MAG: 1-acyl-sn-glycerol-3-phosphate acyltransferase, partial [Bacillota bacterium]